MSQTQLPDEPAWEQVDPHIYEGRKIEAIRIYRQLTRLGLKEAKEAVDAREAELRKTDPKRFIAGPAKGCMGMLLIAAVLFIGTWLGIRLV
jgi:hypothetical protein